MKRMLPLFFLLATGMATAEDVRTKSAGDVLHGTLEKAGSKTVVLIHPGSGPTDRDGNSSILPGKNNSLKYLAEALAKAGVDSLRIDKRGIARSAAAMKSENDIRFDHYVADAGAWIRFLRDVRGYERVIVAGHKRRRSYRHAGSSGRKGGWVCLPLRKRAACG